MVESDGMSAHRTTWNEALEATLTGCVGRSLTETWVDEMGLYGPEDAPCFSHSQLDFVQALTLELRFDDGAILHVGCWQDDYDFALWPKEVTHSEQLTPDPDPDRTLFRVRRFDAFPSGALRDVTWAADDRGNIQTITLHIDSAEVILCAGEVYEDFDGRLKVSDRDESVLIFLSPDAFARTVFNSAVYRIE